MNPMYLYNILPPVRPNVERNYAIFQSIKCLNVAPAQLYVPMFDNTFKANYKRIVLDSYFVFFHFYSFPK